MDDPPFCRIDINGGEPTVHPNFVEISNYLRSRFKGRVVLHLGTNLRPLTRNSNRARASLEAALRTYDMFSVGCDDEHHNIGDLEQLAAQLMVGGHPLLVNVMKDYCNEATRRRILALKKRTGLSVSFSDVHHFENVRPVINDVRAPCKSRLHELLINCDGSAYFCFHQEFAEPMFNLHTVERAELNHFLHQYDPVEFGFCKHCTLYQPGTRGLVRAGLRRGHGASARRTAHDERRP
jgi:hypothetical protein